MSTSVLVNGICAYRYPPVGLVPPPPPRSFFRQFCMAPATTSTVTIGPVVRPIATASRICRYVSFDGWGKLGENGSFKNASTSVGPPQPSFCSAKYIQNDGMTDV